MRSNPSNVFIDYHKPGPLLASYEVYHRQFPEIRGTGCSRSDAVNDLFDQLDRAVYKISDDWHRSLLESTLEDALAFLADNYDSRLVPCRTHVIGHAEPLLAVNGDGLYEVRLYPPEVEWQETEAARPDLLERIGELGWVGATFIRSLGGKPPAPPKPERRSTDRRSMFLQDKTYLKLDSRRGERRVCDRRRSIRCENSLATEWNHRSRLGLICQP